MHRLRAPTDAAAERPAETSEPQARAKQAPPAATNAADPVGAKGARKPFPTRKVLFALLPLALIAGGYFYVTGGAVMSTDNAYVQADMVGVANDVAGIVTTIEVKENQKVAVGDVLFRWTRSRSGWRWTAPRRSSARRATT